jgi:hypothetical protein
MPYNTTQLGDQTPPPPPGSGTNIMNGATFLGETPVPIQPGSQPPSGNFANTTGNGNNEPSWLGTGMYTPGAININASAYNNPIGAQASTQLGNQLNHYLGNTTGQVTPAQAGYGSQATLNSGLSQEQAMANQYGKMAAGQGPSAATVAAQQQGAANLSSAESMLGSARGSGNPAAAQLAARNAQATGANQVAQNTVAGKTQEELAAMGAQSGLATNIAGQGLNEQQLQAGVNASNASQANQVGMGNQQNNLAANTNLMNTLGTQNLAQQQGQIAAQNENAQTQLGQEQIQNNAYTAAGEANQGAMSSLMGGAGAAMGALALL